MAQGRTGLQELVAPVGQALVAVGGLLVVCPGKVLDPVNKQVLPKSLHSDKKKQLTKENALGIVVVLFFYFLVIFL